MKKTVAELAAQQWGIPKNLTMNTPYISMTSDRDICIENHRGIKTFEKNRIIVVYRGGNIMICGDNLHIKHMNSDMILIEGYIKSVIFA